MTTIFYALYSSKAFIECPHFGDRKMGGCSFVLLQPHDCSLFATGTSVDFAAARASTRRGKRKSSIQMSIGDCFWVIYIYYIYYIYILYIYIIYIEVGCGIGMLDYHSTYHILFACREYLHTCPVECGRCSTPNVGK